MPFPVYYLAHPAQCEIHAARNKRFRTVCTGRRFGKTYCLAAEIMDRAGGGKPGDYGWVAPTYNVSDRGIEAFQKIARGVITVTGRMPTRIDFTTDAGASRVWFLSADNPDSIRGFGFLGLVIDEAASIPVDVWNYVLRPTISQTLGWAVLVSTPKGRNWFHDLFTRGMDPNETDYASFKFDSRASPYFPPQEWEEARRTLPENVFRQEYMAEFLEDSAGVFRNIDACLENPTGIPEAIPRHVVIGCDLAKHTDWTVLVAMDAANGRCFAMERFNQLDWPIQKERIISFSRRYRGRVIMDSTGIGDPILDDLKHVLPDIEGYKLNAASKTALIQRLIVAIEQRRVSWPAGACDNWEILINELKRFEYVIGPSGQITYAAPSGFHDDCVIALALANYRRWETENCGRMLRVGGSTRPSVTRGRRRDGVLDW